MTKLLKKIWDLTDTPPDTVATAWGSSDTHASIGGKLLKKIWAKWSDTPRKQKKLIVAMVVVFLFVFFVYTVGYCQIDWWSTIVGYDPWHEVDSWRWKSMRWIPTITGIGLGLLADVLLLVGIVAWRKVVAGK